MLAALSFVFVTVAAVLGVLTPGTATPTARAAKPRLKSLVSRIAEGRRQKVEVKIQNRRADTKDQEGRRTEDEGWCKKEWRKLGASGRGKEGATRADFICSRNGTAIPRMASGVVVLMR